MSIKKLLTMVCAALLTGSLIAADVVLNPNHPERYVVVKGDTLWDISARFLRDPWLWPEVWYVNPQVANPHLIYPGDVLNLVYVDGKPQIQATRGRPTVNMSPRIREESLDNAIPTIPLDAIEPFLTRAIVVHDEEWLREDLADLFEPRDAYIDPDTNEVLGYEALYAGTGPVQKFGDPATIKLVKTAREVRVGNRLLPADSGTLPSHFQPHAVPSGTEGHIISVVDGVQEIGQFSVVTLDLGERDGMEIGHVMRVFQQGDVIKDTVSGKYSDKVKLPDEEAGVVMVFKTFEKVSYGLIMSATRAIHINDYVRTP